MKNIQIEFLILKNKMDKTKLHEIDQNEPERIKKIKPSLDTGLDF